MAPESLNVPGILEWSGGSQPTRNGGTQGCKPPLMAPRSLFLLFFSFKEGMVRPWHAN